MAIFYSKKNKDFDKKKVVQLHKAQKNYKKLFYFSLLGNILLILFGIYQKHLL